MKLSELINKAELPKEAYFNSDVFKMFYKRIYFRNTSISQVNVLLGAKTYQSCYVEIVNDILGNRALYFGEDKNKFTFNKEKFDDLVKSLIDLERKTPDDLKQINKLINSALSQVLCYLICGQQILNPFKERDRQGIERCISVLSDEKMQKMLPEKTKEGNFVVGGLPHHYLYKLTRYYTDEERYKTKVVRGIHAFNVDELVTDNKFIMMLYDIIKTALCRSDKCSTFTANNIIAGAYENSYVAGNFNPLTLYQVINYIKDSARNNKFATPMPDFDSFYDPCGGWGERMVAACLARYPAQFKTIVINDLNKDLKGAYNGILTELKDQVSQKEISFSYEDALSKQNKDKMDLIFTGLPFFNTEQYRNCELERYGKNYKQWLDNWCVPLIKKLVIEDLKPGGILAFNLGKTRIGTKNCNEYDLVKLLLDRLHNDSVNESFRGALSTQSKLNHNNVFYGMKQYSNIVFFQRNNLDIMIPNPTINPFDLDKNQNKANSKLEKKQTIKRSMSFFSGELDSGTKKIKSNGKFPEQHLECSEENQPTFLFDELDWQGVQIQNEEQLVNNAFLPYLFGELGRGYSYEVRADGESPILK